MISRNFRIKATRVLSNNKLLKNNVVKFNRTRRALLKKISNWTKLKQVKWNFRIETSKVLSDNESLKNNVQRILLINFNNWVKSKQIKRFLILFFEKYWNTISMFDKKKLTVEKITLIVNKKTKRCEITLILIIKISINLIRFLINVNNKTKTKRLILRFVNLNKVAIE